MGKIQKTITLVAFIVLSAILLKNLFSKSNTTTITPEIYTHKLKPIAFPKKQFPTYDQSRNDPAIQYAKFWNLAEMYKKNSNNCLHAFADQHPNNLVQTYKTTSLYGIEIGTNEWYELTDAFERYATEACFSFSGYEMENEYADHLKETLTDLEIMEFVKLHKTKIGKKMVSASNAASKHVLDSATNKQRNANNKWVGIYYKKIEELQKTK